MPMSNQLNERVVYLNGDIVPESRALVSFRDRSFKFGDGAFDTTRTFGHRIFKLDEHLDRFYKTLRYLQIDLPVAHKELAPSPKHDSRARDGAPHECLCRSRRCRLCQPIPQAPGFVNNRKEPSP